MTPKTNFRRGLWILSQIGLARLLGTFLGMAPLCWAQSYLADEILTAYPKLIYPLLAACAVYTVVVVLVARKMMKQIASEAAL